LLLITGFFIKVIDSFGLKTRTIELRQKM